MKRIKYAIFLLCSFAVLISLSGCRKSSENIKNIRFPTKYQKNYKNFKFDTEIIVGKERQEFLYESSAQKIKFDTKTLQNQIFSLEQGKLNGDTIKWKDGSSLIIDGDYLAFNSNSRDEEEINLGFSLFQDNYTADQFPVIDKNLEDKDEFKQISSQIANIGIEDAMFYKYYNLDNVSTSTTKSEKAYWLGRQYYEGLPVLSTTFYSGYNDTWAPIQILYAEERTEKMQILYCFEFKKGNKKIQLKSFDQIAKSIEDEYKMLLTEKNYLVTKAELSFWVNDNQVDNSFKMIPVWVLTIREYDKESDTDYVEYQELVNAETAENIESGK